MKHFAFLFLSLFGCAINSIVAQSSSPITARHCDSLGTVYMKAGNYAIADSLFSKALDIKLTTLQESHPKIADSYYSLGVIHWYTGAYDQAESSINKALNIRLEALGEKHTDVASTYNVLGVIYSDTNDYAKAINFHNKALNIRLDLLGENHTDVAKSCSNLGNVYRSMGDFEKAITFHNKALKISLNLLGEQYSDVARYYNNLGNVYYETSDFEKAITFYKKALKINLDQLGEKHPYVARLYNNLGNGYYEIGDFEKAATFHDKAIKVKLAAFGETHPTLANSYINLGLIHYETGNFKKATTLYNKALTILLDEFGEKHLAVTDAYNNLALVMLETGDHDKAIAYHDKALKIKRDLLGEKHIDVLWSHRELAYTYGEIGNFEAADSLWHIVIPQKTEQLKSTYLFLSNAQRVKYSTTFNLINKDFYSFVISHGTESTHQLATNFLLNTKSLALDYAISTSQLIKKIKDTTLIAQYQQLNELNKQAANAEQLTSEESAAIGRDITNIQEEQEALAFQMLQHPKLKSKLNTKTIAWQDIQDHLKPNEATVDFLRVYEKQDSLWAYYAIVITKKQSSPQFIRMTDEKTLAALLKPDLLLHPYYINKRYNRKKLQQLLWQPLEPFLKGIKRVHLSPSDLLHRVPFESLQATDNAFLTEQYEIHYYATIRDVLKEKSKQKAYKDMVLLGDILYDLKEKDNYKEEEIAFRGEKQNTREGIQSLPQTLDEVKRIDNTGKRAGLKTTLLTVDAASEDNVQSFVQKKAPSIFHFATHGVFLPPLEKENNQFSNSQDRLRSSDNPLQRSAIMLYGANESWTKGRHMLSSGEDGILTALEVTALDLQNTDLVVLSACGTGLGNIHNTEGVFGLQRAFKLAGVKYIVASLWDVNDIATKDLMVAFYNNLLKKKQPPVTALRHAKETLKEAGYEPVDWAGFILIE